MMAVEQERFNEAKKNALADNVGPNVVLWAMMPDCQPITDAQAREMMRGIEGIESKARGIPSQRALAVQWLPLQSAPLSG